MSYISLRNPINFKHTTLEQTVWSRLLLLGGVLRHSYGAPKSLGTIPISLANINVNNEDWEKKTEAENSTIYHHAIVAYLQLNLKLRGVIRGVFCGRRRR